MWHAVDKYVATVTYGNHEVIPRHLLLNATNGGEDSPTGAVFELIRALKELAQETFEISKQRGLLTALSFEDIK